MSRIFQSRNLRSKSRERRFGSLSKGGISRTITVVIVVVILIIAGASAYAIVVLNPGTSASTTTSTTTTSTSFSSSTGSIVTSTSTTSPSTSTTAANQNLTVELQTAPGSGIGIYPLTTNTWPENLVYDPLFNYNLTGNSATPIPWLATGYTVDPTGQNWTLTLRQGIHFSDGTSFNATSLKMDIDNMIIAHTETTPYDSFIQGAETYVKSNMNSANQSIFVQNDGIKVLSTYTLQWNLAHPESDLLSFIGGPLAVFFDVSPSAVLAHGGITVGVGNTWLISHSAGSGPYVLDSFNPATGSFVFSANPNWWGISAYGMQPPFKSININVVSNLATQELDLRTGKSDIMTLPSSNLYDFANKTLWTSQHTLASTVSGVNIFGPYLDFRFSLIEMNRAMKTSNGSLATVQPFLNANLRHAIIEAWNESAFIEQSLNGLGAASNGVMLKGMLGYKEIAPYYPYNLTQAKLDLQAACAQLGCSKSNPLQITFIATADTVSELAGSLLTSAINSMQAGVILNLQPLAISAKISTFLSGQFGLSLYVQPNEPPDPLVMLNQFGSTFGTQAGRLGFNNATITQLLAQAGATSDINARIGLYQQIDSMIAQEGNWPQVFQEEAVFPTSARIHITNFNPALNNVLPPIFAMSAM